MLPRHALRVARRWPAAILAVALFSSAARAAQPRQPAVPLDRKEFFRPDLYISTANVPLDDALAELPNRSAWDRFLTENGRRRTPADVQAFVDPRSGAATSLMGAFPLLPGSGLGNAVGLAELSARLGRPVESVTPEVVAGAARQFVELHREVLGIDAAQLGAARVAQVTPELWQVSLGQAYRGVTVRDARVAVSILHGNVVVAGSEAWGNVADLDTAPRLDADSAVGAGFDYAGGRVLADVVVRRPRLEIVPFAPAELQQGEAYAGPIGSGYRHLLAWTFEFERGQEPARWQVLVDAHTGEVLAFRDTHQQVKRSIVGGVYPLTNTGICPSADRCGQMQGGWPMPFADTGFPPPESCANSGGVYNYTSGTALTTLTGCRVKINDGCGAISASSATGNVNLGGANGQHDCQTPGFGGPGNTAAARTTFYGLNKTVEIARGWLPSNAWLQGQMCANTNANGTCGAFYSPGTGCITLYRSGNGCGNVGEILAVPDHEWGHALDDNDAGGTLSNSSEGYADVVALYRSQTSCVGYGFFATLDNGCGATSDGTGFNCNEGQTGGAHCCLDCSGVRDADWDRHADHAPDTALGFVCTRCLTSSGPCGRQVHCAAAPQRQAAWDLPARDLQAPPFGYDRQTAFIAASKLFYQGSGNIGVWYACTCGASSSGCGASNAYLQWLVADDDNGNLNDGTPHMTAIHAAFDRHGIACATPTPLNSGCAGGPTQAPALGATPGAYRVALSWSAVPGATRYWVFRTEGHAGCDFGKALIAEVSGTSYLDTQVLACRKYHYSVVAAGASSACYGRASNCVTAVPRAGRINLCAISTEVDY